MIFGKYFYFFSDNMVFSVYYFHYSYFQNLHTNQIPLKIQKYMLMPLREGCWRSSSDTTTFS